MTSWAQKMAEHFGELTRLHMTPVVVLYTSREFWCRKDDAEAYVSARLAAHFGRIALEQTVNWPVVDSLELLEHAPRR